MPMPNGIDWLNKLPMCGVHTAVDADASANKFDVDSGDVAATGFIVQIYRSGVLIGTDQKASITSGVLSVEDGSTYKITTGDVINWMIF